MPDGAVNMIELDVAARRLHLEVIEQELTKRRKHWTAPDRPIRGYQKLYVETVQQAHLGASPNFLVGGSGAGIPRDSH